MKRWIALSLALCGPALALPERALAQERRTIRIDDMLIDADLIVEIPAWDVSRAHTVNTQFLLQAWDFGVMPVAFADEVSDAERERFLRACARWGASAPFLCTPRTTQSGYLAVAKAVDTGGASSCFSSVGQGSRLQRRTLNLGPNCWSDHTIGHELGHALGFWHEQQRPDRDDYVRIEFPNVIENARSNFNKIVTGAALNAYDFESIMHYRWNEFAIDRTQATVVPLPPYERFAMSLGTGTEPSELDDEAAGRIYGSLLRPTRFLGPTESVRTRFDRAELLQTMERLHAFYFSRLGLNRPLGLSIGGRPDFLGIAAWIFDVYLGARSAGFAAEAAFDIVIASITQTTEWRQKHPGAAPLAPLPFQPYIRFDRNEFLTALQKLDAFYSSAEGLQRPDGLSIASGPDFAGIAAWLFDVYLNARLQGASADAAWVQVVNAITTTDEWRRKH